MRKLSGIIGIIILSMITIDESRSDVQESMLECTSWLTDQLIYIQIKPENLSMAERNSKLRDKDTGIAQSMTPYEFSNRIINSVTTFWNIQESKDKKYYIGEIKSDPDVRFNLNRENLSIVYRLYEEIDVTGQCTILSNDMSFEDHIKKRVDYLQRELDTKNDSIERALQEQLRKNKI
jgi:hypothetical protein